MIIRIFFFHFLWNDVASRCALCCLCFLPFLNIPIYSPNVSFQALKNVSHSVSTAIAQARGQHDPYAVPESHTVPSTAFGELEAYLKAQAPLLSTLYTQSGALALRSREQVCAPFPVDGARFPIINCICTYFSSYLHYFLLSRLNSCLILLLHWMAWVSMRVVQLVKV